MKEGTSLSVDSENSELRLVEPRKVTLILHGKDYGLNHLRAKTLGTSLNLSLMLQCVPTWQKLNTPVWWFKIVRSAVGRQRLTLPRGKHSTPIGTDRPYDIYLSFPRVKSIHGRLQLSTKSAEVESTDKIQSPTQKKSKYLLTQVQQQKRYFR